MRKYYLDAETLNELGDSKNAVKTVNLIRKRAGVGELDENKNWNKDELRQRIYKEYRVEFAFEDNPADGPKRKNGSLNQYTRLL